MHVKKKQQPETTTCIKWERLSIIDYTYRKKMNLTMLNVSHALTYSQTVFTL